MVWRVCLCGLYFCNPLTVGRVVGGMGMGYIFVTRKQWVVGGGDVGYFFVTRECLSFVVFVEDVWVIFL